ncbi:hypothetical protein AAZX31_01G189700 [Glycine max]
MTPLCTSYTHSLVVESTLISPLPMTSIPTLLDLEIRKISANVNVFQTKGSSHPSFILIRCHKKEMEMQ